MPYTPDALDDTQPIGSVVPASTAAAEFRTIKTKLIEHETAITAITAIADDLAALDARIDAYDGYTFLRNRQWLTGSGNFTVPAGVTSLYVSVAAGGRAGFHMVRDNISPQWTFEVDPRVSPITRKKITVAPADVIAYSVGADEAISRAGATISRDTAPGNSTFGSITAFPQRLSDYREQHDASSAFDESYPTYLPVDMARRYPITLHGAPTTETIYQGAGAHILVEW